MSVKTQLNLAMLPDALKGLNKAQTEVKKSFKNSAEYYSKYLINKNESSALLTFEKTDPRFTKAS